LIVKIVPVWDEKEDRLLGYKVFIAGETFEVRDVFINDEREKDPCYTVRFLEAVDVQVEGEDDIIIYT